MEDREELGLRAFKGIVCGRGGARYTSPRSTHARDRAGQGRTGRDGMQNNALKSREVF